MVKLQAVGYRWFTRMEIQMNLLVAIMSKLRVKYIIKVFSAPLCENKIILLEELHVSHNLKYQNLLHYPLEIPIIIQLHAICV